MTRIAALLFCSLACAAPASAQDTPRAGASPVSLGVELGYAMVDGRHTLNSSPAFLTGGLDVRTRGRVFAFAGARVLFSSFIYPDDSPERVQDEDGYDGVRTTGRLGGGPWVRAGIGAPLTGSTGSPTVSLAGGSMGLGEVHPWLGASVGVPVRGGWRVEAELGWDRNWVEDRFPAGQPGTGGQPAFEGYTRRSAEWFSTFHLSAHFRL